MRSAYINLSVGLVLATVAGALITIMSEMHGQFTWAGVDFRIVLDLAAAGGLALAAYGVRQIFFLPAPEPAQMRN